MPTGAPTPARLLAALAAYGAPLTGCDSNVHEADVRTLEETRVAALHAAHDDATILRVLPLVVARPAAPAPTCIFGAPRGDAFWR